MTGIESAGILLRRASFHFEEFDPNIFTLARVMGERSGLMRAKRMLKIFGAEIRRS
jgi:hypothetical protein